MKKILLTQGKFAIVDDEDFEYLNKNKWCFSGSRGYALRGIRLGGSRKHSKVKGISMHRVILEQYNLLKNGLQVDHINRDKLDNRKINLRMVTMQQNQVNRTKQVNNTSGFKGVSWYEPYKKWVAGIRVNKKRIHLGYFINIKEAAVSYNKKAQEVFGKYAYINTI